MAEAMKEMAKGNPTKMVKMLRGLNEDLMRYEERLSTKPRRYET